jgi:hypothetical protein
MKEIISVMCSKDGDELFEKVTEILNSFGITVTDSNGNVKDLYTVLCEVAEVWNKDTK